MTPFVRPLCAIILLLSASVCGPLAAQDAKKVTVDDVIPFLNSKSPQARLAGVEMAGSFGTAGKAAILTLGTIARDDFVPEIADQAALSLAKIGPAAVDQLCRCLEDGRFTVQVRTLKALQKLGPEGSKAVPHLTDALREPDARIRLEVIRALGEIGPAAAPAVAPLCRLTRNPSVEIRKESWNALKNIGGEAVSELTMMAKNADPAVRRDTLGMLGFLARDNRDAFGPLTDALKDPEGEIRLGAAKELGKLGPRGEEALDQIFPLLKEKDVKIQQGALAAILAIGAQDKQKLLDSLAKANQEGQWAIPFFLAQYGDRAVDAVKPLMKIVAGKQGRQRLGAILALAQIGEDAREAVPLLQKVMFEPDPQLHSAAAFALMRIHVGSRNLMRQELVKTVLTLEKTRFEFALRPYDRRNLTNPYLQAQFDRIVDLHLMVSTTKPRFLETDAEQGRDYILRNLDYKVRTLIQLMGPEAIPALVRGANLSQQFKLGFC